MVCPGPTPVKEAGLRPERVISGGQTGVDRAALDVALALDIPCGGWCPAGRRAEDGAIPERYPLTETASAEYGERTERNVAEADATLIISRGPPTGGTAFTLDCAARHHKPVHVVECPAEAGRPSSALRAWMAAHAGGVLNVAGPRETTAPGIYREAHDVLMALWRSGEEPPRG